MGPRLTQLAHAWLQPVLVPGAQALDATAGNGWDALFLAEHIAPGGTLWVVDRQEVALQTTRQRLAAIGGAISLQVRLGPHQEMERLLTGSNPSGEKDAERHFSVGEPLAKEWLDAAIFNLGYLPGGDRSIITEASSTCHALSVVAACLRVGGRLAVVAYPGHPGGAEETQAVAEWTQTATAAGAFVHAPEMIQATTAEQALAFSHRPRGFLLEKKSSDAGGAAG